MTRPRVLIADDSVVIRKILADALQGDPSIEVAGTAANGRIALSKIEQLKPDLVTLDVEMPELDGLATLRAIRKDHPRLPVIMFSTLTARGAAVTLDALAAGASDYVTKPANVGCVTTAIGRIRDELIPKIKALCDAAAPVSPCSGGAPVLTLRNAAVRLAPANLPRRMPIELVVVGVSTGGPNALATVVPALPADLPVPVLIVQHMPPIFTRLLAERLAAQSALAVREAARGEALLPGTVYIAPGDFHMSVERAGLQRRIALSQSAPENSCRPAVDVLFRSAAAAYGASTLGVVLTGMGQDGWKGCEALRQANATVVVQDEATSVVWGMPGYVARAGLAEQLIPLDDVARQVSRLVFDSRIRLRAAG